jgi:hypothetical protein
MVPGARHGMRDCLLAQRGGKLWPVTLQEVVPDLCISHEWSVRIRERVAAHLATASASTVTTVRKGRLNSTS